MGSNRQVYDRIGNQNDNNNNVNHNNNNESAESCSQRIIQLFYFGITAIFIIYLAFEIKNIVDSYYPKVVSTSQAALVILILIFLTISVGLTIINIFRLILCFNIAITIGLAIIFAYISIESDQQEILEKILKYNNENLESDQVRWFNNIILKDKYKIKKIE